MNKFYLAFISLVVIATSLAFWASKPATNHRKLPVPTDVYVQQEEHRDSRKKLWIELMHHAKPGTDWRRMYYKNLWRQYLDRPFGEARNPTESFANGKLKGQWNERGAKNVAGSILDLEYLPDIDRFYCFGSGGCLFKGNRTGTIWQSLSPDMQFNGNFLEVVPNNSGGKRILTVQGSDIYYSDNEGTNWSLGTVPSSGYDGWGAPKELSSLSNNDVYYLRQVWDPIPWGSRIWLYRSTDKGATFTKIYDFGDVGLHACSMWAAPSSTTLRVLMNGRDLYSVSGNTVSLVSSSATLPIGVNKCQLTGHLSATNVLTLYALENGLDLYRSTDGGVTWVSKGTLPSEAWDVGISVSLSSNNKITYGDVECHRSTNGGTSWTTVNGWGEYYSDVANKLHADIMRVKYFRTNLNAEFALCNNHGGVYISTDHLVTNTNIGLTNLNNAQYYDVVTDPTDANYLYAGSQDQGHQRSTTGVTNSGVLDFEQVISGDYGHMAFSRSGQSLWTVYPGGWITYYHNPKTSGYNSEWTLTGDDKPNYGWIIPTSAVGTATQNSIYVGGGNVNGGSGSYLIKLTAANAAPYNITSSQYNYNFRTNSNSGSSNISAIRATSLNTNRIYVATDDGTFFYSNDAGTTWAKATGFDGPDGFWLYGSSILPSKLNANKVWFAGSGYSNDAVWVSNNGGQSFSSVSQGLPATLIHEIVANTDETMLFAATEIGPYVYVVADNMWYSMRGVGVPVQDYTSVEFIPTLNTVRFGTYGRGIWDYKINRLDIVGTIYNAACGTGSGEIKLTVSQGVAPYTYAWSNGSTSSNPSALAAGTHTVTVTDNSGTTETASFVIAATGTISKPTNILAGGGCSPTKIVLSWEGPNTGSYEIRYRISGTTTWTNLGNVGQVHTKTISGGLLPNTTYQTQTRYVCPNGSTKSAYVTKSKKTTNCTTALVADNENMVLNNLRVSPNPANDYTIVSFENTTEATIRVFNMNGQLVYNAQATDTQHRIPTAFWSDGIYLVEVGTATKRQTSKFVVHH